jgi:hypothetical protein
MSLEAKIVPRIWGEKFDTGVKDAAAYLVERFANFNK